MSTVDLMVVGGGLAGAAVCWQAHRRGLKFVLFDRRDADASSRVAAGLVTPITGARAAPSWRWDEFYTAAIEHYRDAQSAGSEFIAGKLEATATHSKIDGSLNSTQLQFWFEQPAIRIFQNHQEREVFLEKCNPPSSQRSDLAEQSVEPTIRLNVSDDGSYGAIMSNFGYATMAPAARLDTVSYLDTSLRYFGEKQVVVPECVDVDEQFQATPFGVRCRKTGIEARCVIFCQGFAARSNGMFQDLPLHPARGDILEIESPSAQLRAVVHSTAWAVPIGNDRYLVGATYDRHNLDSLVAMENHAVKHRMDIQSRWESMVQGTFARGDHRILVHRAAVRPASYDRHPLIGRHRSHDWAFCLNGLGSKGTLMSPKLANDLLDHAFNERPIAAPLDWTRSSKKQRNQR